MMQLGQVVIEADRARRRSADEVAARRQGEHRSCRRAGFDGDHDVVSAARDRH